MARKKRRAGFCSSLQRLVTRPPEARPGSLWELRFWILPKRLPRGTLRQALPTALGPRLPVSAASLRCDSAAPREWGLPKVPLEGAAACFPVPQLLPWECGPDTRSSKISAGAKNMDFKM